MIDLIASENIVCAGHPDGGRSSCQGDSEGPLVIKNKFFGIVSQRQLCGLKYFAEAYTQVSRYSIWIKILINYY